MNRTGKIILGIAAAVAVFALGVEYSPQVQAFMSRVKDRLSGGSNLESLKDRIAKEFMMDGKDNGVYGIGTREGEGKTFLQITVKNEQAKGRVEKFLAKNNLDKHPVEFRFGEMAKAL
jgi:hypothetical protein